MDAIDPRRALRRLLRDRAATAAAAVLALLVVACIVAPWISPHRYDRTDLALGAAPPSWSHWFGTDAHGRDLFARVFVGGRVSFAVGAIATIVSAILGVTWGGAAGYAGGRVDAVMMRVVDGLYALPRLVVVLVVMVFFGSEKTVFYRAFRATVGVLSAHPEDPSFLPFFRIALVFATLGGLSWMTIARVARAQVIALRAEPFVEAARAIGAGRAAVLARHLLPNALGPILVYTALTVPEVMMTEAFLSFLGLGTQEPLPSWGQLIAIGAETMDLYPWLLVAPTSMLAITLFASNLLGDGVRDALDPRSKHAERARLAS